MTPTPNPTQEFFGQLGKAILESNTQFQETLGLLVAILAMFAMILPVLLFIILITRPLAQSFLSTFANRLLGRVIFPPATTPILPERGENGTNIGKALDVIRDINEQQNERLERIEQGAERRQYAIMVHLKEITAHLARLVNKE